MRVVETKLCSIEGCERPASSKGYCRLHYKRLWRHGDPLHTVSLDERKYRAPRRSVLTQPTQHELGRKTCVRCQRELPIEMFSRRADRQNGYSRFCYPCGAENQRERMQVHPDPVLMKRKQRLRTYGLTIEAYDAMVLAQGGACASCKRPGERLGVDHDHACCPKLPTCGRCTRGLLCGNCNVMLGHAGDLPERLRLGAEYLEMYRAC